MPSKVSALWKYSINSSFPLLSWKTARNKKGKSFFHSSTHWWNVSSFCSIIQVVFIGELPVAPGEICILIYLSYILYISKFFIPLLWPHASFMASSAVFTGQTQTHFTRLGAAVPHLFHHECVRWMNNSAAVVNFSPPRWLWHHLCRSHQLFCSR